MMSSVELVLHSSTAFAKKAEIIKDPRTSTDWALALPTKPERPASLQRASVEIKTETLAGGWHRPRTNKMMY
jgi:hypothetical protein